MCGLWGGRCGAPPIGAGYRGVLPLGEPSGVPPRCTLGGCAGGLDGVLGLGRTPAGVCVRPGQRVGAGAPAGRWAAAAAAWPLWSSANETLLGRCRGLLGRCQGSACCSDSCLGRMCASRPRPELSRLRGLGPPAVGAREPVLGVCWRAFSGFGAFGSLSHFLPVESSYSCRIIRVAWATL